MPLVKRCVICGRITESQHSAHPYKENGVACECCFVNTVLPAIKDKKNYFRQKYAKQKGDQLNGKSKINELRFFPKRRI